jgi:hypothetical protein
MSIPFFLNPLQPLFDGREPVLKIIHKAFGQALPFESPRFKSFVDEILLN